MITIMSNFKGVILFLITLLFTQQSLAAYAPMQCHNMKNNTIISTDKNYHSASQMTMNGHDSRSKDKIHSHEQCDVCNSEQCLCSGMVSCFGSTIFTSTQAVELRYTLFLDHGIRFISQVEFPNSVVYLNPFRPPIYI